MHLALSSGIVVKWKTIIMKNLCTEGPLSECHGSSFLLANDDFKKCNKLGVVAYTLNPISQEAEAD